jgi:hypothetical protein
MPEDILTPHQQGVEKVTPDYKAAQDDAAERRKRRQLRLQQRTLLSDCSLMLRYALDESCRLPADLIKDIATVDALLKSKGKDPLSDIPPELVKESPKGSPAAESIDDNLMRVHNALSDLVAPATALSLRETDPELVWFGMPRIVQWTIYGAAIFLVWFLICVPKPELKKPKEDTTRQPAVTTQSTPSPSPKIP